MTESGRTARRHILVIVNARAGSARPVTLRRLIEQLQGIGCNTQVHKPTSVDETGRLLGEIDCQRFDAIAVAGGDGTINRVLNALPAKAPPLAILPLGTVNLLAKEIGLPRSIAGIAETVAYGPSRPITVGDVNGHRFAVMASVGLDAEVVEHLNLDLKRYIGKWAYLYETIKQVMVSPPETFRLRLGDEERRPFGVIIANGRHYAGHYVTSPAACLGKRSLEICQLDRPGRLAPLRYLISLVTGGFAERADVRIDEATDLEILGPAGAPVQADGDILCRLPATIRILPKAVELVFPANAQGLRRS